MKNLSKKGTIILTILALFISLLFAMLTNTKKIYYGAQSIYRVYLNGNSIGLIKDPKKLESYINQEQVKIKEQYNIDTVYAPNGLTINKELTYNESLKEAKDIYEEADMDFERKIFKETQDLDMLQKQYDGESSLQKRLDDFKKALLKNQILEEFDREIFESIIEKVIVGGYNENGESDPYKIIFIYKTGFKDEIKNAILYEEKE